VPRLVGYRVACRRSIAARLRSPIWAKSQTSILPRQAIRDAPVGNVCSGACRADEQRCASDTTQAQSQSLKFDQCPLVEQVTNSVGELHDKEPGRQASPQLPEHTSKLAGVLLYASAK